ncbi:LysR family transcriptional regulator ArgP [Cellulomonas uda]|uniref:HTH-type transcriptional regulator LysG n=1 Tax=Cellulomonas uda TaxID=1714 RepID=A0A4Y3KG39_CELUD|nr:LysR family transcriptional regulator ArgP [Cellulomonas uda]NII65030.1 LysR family transcriptional regulator (chromosome initiation inhibitor) [Cellulomonas uda]GEA82035.1 putative transcriptional regulator, LysR family protein [Cellulomonas uda]
MNLDAEQLRALAAVLEEGTFEAAAARLHVTPSAVSQRVRALEQRVGQVLVVRSRPCRATEPGAVLARLAGQVALLERDAAAELAGAGHDEAAGAPTRLAVAVNADSLSSWFPAALVGLPEGVVVDLRREDQDRTAELLRDGTVTAAVTAQAHAVQGCRVRPLGAMRYLGLVAPAVRDRWFPDGVTAAALERAPVLAFNRADTLQHRFAAALVGRDVAPPVHHVPSNTAFLELLAAGLGWGMASEAAAADALATGALVDVAPGRWLDVPLYWQHWSLRTPTLDDLTARVVRAASTSLR